MSKEKIPEDRIVPAIGAVLFASGEPVSDEELLAVLDGLSKDELREGIEALRKQLESAGIGLGIENIAGGYRLATDPGVGAWVRQFFRQRNRTRLSPAALETLAIVAYRQPVTSPEIQAIRSKDPSASLKGLLDKKLIRILGRKKVVGNPLLYGTSKHFLVHFGLDSLKDLPSIEEFEEFIHVLDAGQAELFEGVADEAQGEPAVDEEARVDAEDGEELGSYLAGSDGIPAVRMEPTTEHDH